MKWDHIPCTPKWGTFDIGATSATNVAQNVAQFYLYFKYKSVYVHENECILIKHGEIEDSKRPNRYEGSD